MLIKSRFLLAAILRSTDGRMTEFQTPAPSTKSSPPCGNIHPVAVNAVLVLDHIPGVDGYYVPLFRTFLQIT